MGESALVDIVMAGIVAADSCRTSANMHNEWMPLQRTANVWN
jgi:hypothetical protein